MRLTIHHSLSHQGATDCGDVDLEVARHTRLRDILAEFPAQRVWCGDVALDLDHEAGDWPLLAGAILSATPRRASIAPAALHLAAIAGPDAGVLIPVDHVIEIGSAPPAAVLRDGALDARHATAWATSAGVLRVKDHGSVNGTGVWSRSGGTFSWRGQRRVSTVRIGDVIAIGRTLLEARTGAHLEGETATGRDSPGPIEPQEPPDSAASADAHRGTPLSVLRAVLRRIGDQRFAHRDRHHDPRHLASFPDPTRASGWSGPIIVGGVHAADLARAVILARGRRPPLPMPLDEPWLAWLPPALADDGPIRVRPDAPVASASDGVALTAETDHTTLRIGAVTTVGPVVRVAKDTADALARSQAGLSPDPPPPAVRWADAAALTSRPTGGNAGIQIVAGVRTDDPTVPWTISLDPGFPHTVVAGAQGSGKTTLLATMAGALAIDMAPAELELVILCAREPGPLTPFLDLPHVKASASHVRPHDALRILDCLETRASLTVVIADDLDALGPDGRAVTARLEAIALRSGPGRVHVAMATRRPTAVLTPALRASAGTSIALRTDCESDSIEVAGIAAASGIPRDAKGTAIVRSGGLLDRVQVALPLADRLPRVHRCGTPLPAGRNLADAARGACVTEGRERPAPACRERPAS